MNEQVKVTIGRMLQMVERADGTNMAIGQAKNLADNLRSELALIRRSFVDKGHRSDITALDGQINDLQRARSDKGYGLSRLHYAIYGLSIAAGQWNDEA